MIADDERPGVERAGNRFEGRKSGSGRLEINVRSSIARLLLEGCGETMDKHARRLRPPTRRTNPQKSKVCYASAGDGRAAIDDDGLSRRE